MAVLDLPVHLADPLEVGDLTLHPLIGGAPAPIDYTTGRGADSAEAFDPSISELPEPTVDTLLVANPADTALLLLDGEALIGGDQDRTLNISLLVPAGATMPVPVSCVEAGRWGRSGRRSSYRHGVHLSPKLRSTKNRSSSQLTRLEHELRGEAVRAFRSDQGAVWSEVDALLARKETSSDSSAWMAATEAREPVVIPEPLGGQVGVIVLNGTELLGLDLFDRPATLAAHWDALVSAYLLDAQPLDESGRPIDPTRWVDAATADGAHGDGSRGFGGSLVEQVERFLAAVAAADHDELDRVGVGQQLRFDDQRLHVAALAVDGVPVHLAAFPIPARAAW